MSSGFVVVVVYCNCQQLKFKQQDHVTNLLETNLFFYSTASVKFLLNMSELLACTCVCIRAYIIYVCVYMCVCFIYNVCMCVCVCVVMMEGGPLHTMWVWLPYLKSRKRNMAIALACSCVLSVSVQSCQFSVPFHIWFPIAFSLP